MPLRDAVIALAAKGWRYAGPAAAAPAVTPPLIGSGAGALD